MRRIITFIVPCYNVENYIENCVKSVVNQGVSNYEIYLMDDLSTDNTLSVCKNIEKKYKNVFLLEHEKNEGGAAIRNHILDYLKENKKDERWICFLDSDDEIEEGSLSIINNILDNNNKIDFLLLGLKYIYPNREICECLDIDNDKRIIKGASIAQIIANKVPWSTISCCGNKIYNQSFIESNGLRFDKNKYAFNEDGGFAVEAFSKAHEIMYLDIPYYYYFQRIGSTMHSYRHNCYTTIRNVNEALERFFNTNDIEGDELVLSRKINIVNSVLINELQYNYSDRFNKLYEKIRIEENMEDYISISKNKNFSLGERISALFLARGLKKCMKYYLLLSIKKNRAFV